MKIKVIAFGYLTDILGKNPLELEDVSNTDLLKNKLCDKYPDLKKREYKIAVNQQIISENLSLDENSEVVLLPPFAGG
jgi:molybdopterin converting factor small subunit